MKIRKVGVMERDEEYGNSEKLEEQEHVNFKKIGFTYLEGLEEPLEDEIYYYFLAKDSGL